MIRTSREFGAAIREKRRSTGLTQEQLAARSGVTRAFLIDLEGGKETSQLGKCLIVAAAVGMDLADLNDAANIKASAAFEDSDDDLSHVPRF